MMRIRRQLRYLLPCRRIAASKNRILPPHGSKSLVDLTHVIGGPLPIYLFILDDRMSDGGKFQGMNAI
jgi:hypothetical protein